LVLTDNVQLLMWWTSFCLHIRGFLRTDLRPITLPSCSTWLSQLWKAPPPERIDHGRPTGSNKAQQRQQRYQQALDELARGPPFIDRILHRPPKIQQRKLLLRALQIAATIATVGVPTITLSEDRCLHQRLRRYKRHGYLGSTTNLRDEDLVRLRQVLTEFEPQSLYSSTLKDSSFHLIVDTGCSHSATGCIDDFIPNSIHDLAHPVEMEGIAGGLLIRQKGRVRYELLTDDGDVHVLETTAYLIPELSCRFFSPQAYFQEQYRSGLDPRESANLSIRRNRGVITWEDKSQTTFHLCDTTHLPRLRVYRNALDDAKALALKGCVTDEINQNLTSIQKLVLRFHF
jgi:hypothetical protein